MNMPLIDTLLDLQVLGMDAPRDADGARWLHRVATTTSTALGSDLATVYHPKRSSTGVHVSGHGRFMADAAAALLVAEAEPHPRRALLAPVAAGVLAVAVEEDAPLGRASAATGTGLRVAEALDALLRTPLSDRGWQPEGIVSRLAAAVAISALLRLDAAQTRHAIGLAATAAGGLARDGATLLLAARCAADAVGAARLAQHGFTAARDPLQGRRGLLPLMLPDEDPTLIGELRVAPASELATSAADEEDQRPTRTLLSQEMEVPR